MCEVRDKNTAYLYVGCVPYEETEHYITNLTRQVGKDLQLTDPGQFLINMPVDREGVKQSYCYIWWDDARVREHIFKHYETGSCEFEGTKYVFIIRPCTCELPNNPRLNLSSLTTSRPLPNWVTEEQLTALFARFNVSGYFSCRLVGKQHERYPLIRYDRNSNDAIFALLMRKIVRLTYGNESILLFFKYSQQRSK